MRLIHLVYVHGFQGNDTTFQSFPTDLQAFLSTHISSHSELDVMSTIYPTYKSVKPIAFATAHFLEWLTTQPPGPVILLGHSMGGLLAAEAATHPANITGTNSKRIIGVVAFDTPYLGMHPHVVVTGIASLFKNDSESKKTDTEMNDTTKVTVIDGKVTEDWEAYKKTNHANSRPVSLMPANATSPSPSPSPRPSALQSTLTFVDRTKSFLSSHSDDPFVKWARKHVDDPFSASKRWVVERFQFGSCMFDPPGLKDRYTRLVAWKGGMWVNYWTQTVPKVTARGKDSPAVDGLTAQKEIADNDVALVESGLVTQGEHPVSPSSVISTSPNTTPSPSVLSSNTEDALENVTKKELKRREAEAKKAKKAQKDKVEPGRHFVVLATGLGQLLGGGENWEKVEIAGVQDEVAAHCGLFFRDQNLDYDGFIERVGKKVLRWCETA